MSNTRIEWTRRTWNPVTGCTKISPGCKHCYAERMSKRLAGRFGYPTDDPFSVTTHPDRLIEPLHWKKPSMIFVCSMGDLFHDDVPFEYIAAVFGVMAECSRHTFQLLSKRPEKVLGFFKWIECQKPSFHSRGIHRGVKFYAAKVYDIKGISTFQVSSEEWAWPLPNVWVGVTAEDQDMLDKRIPILLRIPASVRFVSCEPLLGPIDLSEYFIRFRCFECKNEEIFSTHSCPKCGSSVAGNQHFSPSLDWVIAGGEGGPGARPMHPDWARSVRDQCIAAQVPFFFKKWGRYAPINGGFSRPGDLIHYSEIDTEPVSMTTDQKRQVDQGKLDGSEWHQYPK
jgi:protein gp37